MIPKEDVEKIITKLTDMCVERLAYDSSGKKQLLALYLAGTILTEDRTPTSDIDLFGIVESDFDFKNEEEINTLFDEQKNTLCGGIEARFRAIPLCALEGGEQRGVIKFLNPVRLLRKFPFFKLLWGKQFDFEKDFPLKPMELKTEAIYLIARITQSITDLRNTAEKFPFRDFPKQVIELVRVEAEKEKGFKFDPSYSVLSRYLMNEEDHIIHKAMRLRQKCTREEILEFCTETETYIAKLMEQIKEWS